MWSGITRSPLPRGSNAIELQDYAGAIGHLTKALELKPGDQEARVSLGVAYARSNDNGRAKEELQKAVAADASTAARAMSSPGPGKLGQQEEAKSQMAQAAKSADPEVSAAARGYLGEAGRKKGLAVSLSGGLQYDSNVILEQDDPIGPKAKKADWRGC